MLFDKTKCIDISKLENENQKLLFLGFLVGIICVASIDPFLSLRMDTYTSTVQTEKTELRKPIPVELIYIPSQKEEITPPVLEPEQTEPPVIERVQKNEVPPEIVEKAETETDTISFLQQPVSIRKFPDLTGQSIIPQEQISIPETIRMPKGWELFPEPPPEPTVTIPVEKVRDKRREFKTSFFGIHLDGIPSIPIHLARNAPNFIKWKIKDIMKKRRVNEMTENNFTTISEKDLRLLILVWRDGLLDTHKLSKEDREFIHEAQTDDSEIMTHETYLLGMEKRGLVSSLVFDDNLVFRANFTRNEVLEAFINASESTADEDKNISLNTVIELINAYGDSTTSEITITSPR
ncbi:hypothetical protein ACFL50_00445 [Candidatus Latescibacterota bacterium]